jgi:hypothetical protein
MATYMLRAIDPALWARVKARAASEGRPLKSLFLALLADYASHGLRQDDRRARLRSPSHTPREDNR